MLIRIQIGTERCELKQLYNTTDRTRILANVQYINASFMKNASLIAYFPMRRLPNYMRIMMVVSMAMNTILAILIYHVYGNWSKCWVLRAYVLVGIFGQFVNPLVSCSLFTGSKFLCSALVAPVKNENNEVILFILNLEDITDAPVKSDSYRNSLKNSE